MNESFENAASEIRRETADNNGQAVQQFSIGSMLWITTAVAMLLAHAQSLGPQSLRLLFTCLGFWVVSSLLLSLVSRQPKSVVFWSGVMVVEAFLAVTAVRTLGFSQACGWGLVGAVSGGFCASGLVQRAIPGSFISALLGVSAMASCFWYFQESLHIELWLDLAGAASVSIVLWYFIEFLGWFMVRSRQSPAVLAAWLTLSVLAGNWLVQRAGL